MFWAITSEEPQLAGETNGLMLLTEQDIIRLCEQNRSYTYNDFVVWGGHSFTRKPYPDHFQLEPLGQLRFLAKLLVDRPELVRRNYCN
jgi:hypothetical protein